jgi:hypothetical protein
MRRTRNVFSSFFAVFAALAKPYSRTWAMSEISRKPANPAAFLMFLQVRARVPGRDFFQRTLLLGESRGEFRYCFDKV